MGESLRPGCAVQVRVPASSANLGPGFDSVGLALGLWDTCTATVTDEPGLRIEVTGQGAAEVPRDASHLVYRSMLRAWQELSVRPPAGLTLRCDNAVPHGRGLGSSATAIVTGIVAAQGLQDVCRGSDQGIDLAFANSLAASMEGHPDNSSASVFGGLTLSWSDDDEIETLRLRLHPEVDPVVVVPSEQLSTAKARSVLPTHVRHADAARNSARTALLVHALTSDPAYLLPATREWLHQEARRESFAASMSLVDDLRSRGHAAVISGAGPSVLVLTTRSSAAQVAAAVPGGWQMLRPGVPIYGAEVSQVTDRTTFEAELD
jgi:homoserine kinase